MCCLAVGGIQMPYKSDHSTGNRTPVGGSQGGSNRKGSGSSQDRGGWFAGTGSGPYGGSGPGGSGPRDITDGYGKNGAGGNIDHATGQRKDKYRDVNGNWVGYSGPIGGATLTDDARSAATKYAEQHRFHVGERDVTGDLPRPSGPAGMLVHGAS